MESVSRNYHWKLRMANGRAQSGLSVQGAWLLLEQARCCAVQVAFAQRCTASVSQL